MRRSGSVVLKEHLPGRHKPHSQRLVSDEGGVAFSVRHKQYWDDAQCDYVEAMDAKSGKDRSPPLGGAGAQLCSPEAPAELRRRRHRRGVLPARSSAGWAQAAARTVM